MAWIPHFTKDNKVQVPPGAIVSFIVLRCVSRYLLGIIGFSRIDWHWPSGPDFQRNFVSFETGSRLHVTVLLEGIEMVWKSSHKWHKRSSWLLSTYKCDSKPLQKPGSGIWGCLQSTSSFDLGFFANVVVTTKKYLRCIRFLTSAPAWLPVCLSREQPTLCLQCKGLFLQDHLLFSFLFFIPVKIIGLVAKRAFQLSDFTHLQFREPTGILDEGLTPNKLRCFFPQITGLQRRGKIYIQSESKRRLLGVGERKEGKLGTERASYFSSFLSKIPANMLAVPSGIRDNFDYV